MKFPSYNSVITRIQVLRYLGLNIFGKYREDTINE